MVLCCHDLSIHLSYPGPYLTHFIRVVLSCWSLSSNSRWKCLSLVLLHFWLLLRCASKFLLSSATFPVQRLTSSLSTSECSLASDNDSSSMLKSSSNLLRYLCLSRVISSGSQYSSIHFESYTDVPKVRPGSCTSFLNLASVWDCNDENSKLCLDPPKDRSSILAHVGLLEVVPEELILWWAGVRGRAFANLCQG